MFSSSSSQVSGNKLYVDDVFSAYTYKGTETTSSAYTPNIINNGIDLATNGGLVWVKSRDIAIDNVFYDTVRNVGNRLSSNTTAAQVGPTLYGVTSFNNNGFTVADSTGGGYVNAAPYTYVSWAFRKAPKFFDIVTYNGVYSAIKVVNHSLGVAPGMIIIKSHTQDGSNWAVFHRSRSGEGGYLNFPNQFSSSYNNITSANSSTFTLPINGNGTNIELQSYTAYLFAHDPDTTDGIIQCGAFTTDGSGNATVSLGWEPQYVMFKRTDSTGDWTVSDSMRGMEIGGNGKELYANLTNAESGQNIPKPTATGFYFSGYVSSATYIYMAIRRPNKPPTVGTQVFSTAVSTNDTLPIATGFPADMFILSERSAGYGLIFDRLRGAGIQLKAYVNNAESSTSAPNQFNGMASTTPNQFGSPTPVVVNAFKRAPGVFDVVCYTGAGVARTVPHSLGVTPELVIVKSRSISNNWTVFSNDVSAGSEKLLFLNASSGPQSSAIAWNNTSPSASVFTVGSDYGTNQSGNTFVAYLFASKAGISKIGSYIGNGSSQTIDAGFTTGARFVLIKRTDSTGDWYVWDTVRGIVAGNDPHLSLNTAAAEVATDDSIDPDTSGFIVNQVAATNINVTSATYIFLAFA